MTLAAPTDGAKLQRRGDLAYLIVRPSLIKTESTENRPTVFVCAPISDREPALYRDQFNFSHLLHREPTTLASETAVLDAAERHMRFIRNRAVIDVHHTRVELESEVRTLSPDLMAQLDGAKGLDWREFLPLIGSAIQCASPTRVVRNAIGRIEVFTAIPPPDGKSPDGPHTHFPPTYLIEGSELASKIEMPEGYVACATYYP
jgi:hypothetical protein